jgi:hypothetical protein
MNCPLELELKLTAFGDETKLAYATRAYSYMICLWRWSLHELPVELELT